VYLIFDNLKDAHEYIRSVNVTNDSIDITLYDYEYNIVEYFPAPRWK
jgi:hypothetical protein